MADGAYTGAPCAPGRRLTIQQRFQAYHEANPQVYNALLSLAWRYHRTLGEWPGIGMLWEVARWELALETRTPDRFRMNNNYRSRYARLMIEQKDVPVDAFELRKLRAA